MPATALIRKPIQSKGVDLACPNVLRTGLVAVPAEWASASVGAPFLLSSLQDWPPRWRARRAEVRHYGCARRAACFVELPLIASVVSLSHPWAYRNQKDG